MSGLFLLLYRNSNLAADLVETAHDAALQQRPEAINDPRGEQPSRRRHSRRVHGVNVERWGQLGKLRFRAGPGVNAGAAGGARWTGHGAPRQD
jgi:hypothetical protein